MKLRSKVVINLLLLNSLIFLNCKSFWGYDYEADPIPDSATISGKVINLFTSEPVYYAKVQVASQFTRTDENGEYILHYFYESDEDRDKPVPITISAMNYFSYSKSIIIYPQNNFFDAALEYAAPLISKLVLVDYDGNDSIYVCQTLVKDYQGAEGISSVIASFIYWNTNRNQIEKDEVLMEFNHYLSNEEAFYQVIYYPINPIEFDTLIFQHQVAVDVFDSNGYHNSAIINTIGIGPDSLLFPVQF